MSDHYILDGRETKKVDLMTWAKWLETADRHVAKEKVGVHLVSTVFLGLNHQYGDGPPLLFETMVFKGNDGADLWCERCSTWDEAEAMHKRGCEYVRANLLN